MILFLHFLYALYAIMTWIVWLAVSVVVIHHTTIRLKSTSHKLFIRFPMYLMWIFLIFITNLKSRSI